MAFHKALPLLAILLCPTSSWAKQAAPIVAVFDIQDKTGSIDQHTLHRLSAYLSSKLAEGGAFQLVPRGQVKARLTKQKIESYKQCYDEKCQIEIGRELAAQKSLATQIAIVGSRCVVMSVLYDLRKATSEASSSHKGGCSKDEIAESLEQVVSALKKQAEPDTNTTLGSILVRSVPPKAKVFIGGGQPKGTTPVLVSGLKAGSHVVVLRKQDYRYTGSIVVMPGKVAEVTLQMSLSPEAKTLRDAQRALQKGEEQTRAKIKHKRSRKRLWAYVGLGVALAAASAAGALYGVGFYTRGESDKDYLASKSQVEMDHYWANVESADGLITAGHVLAGVSAVALILSIYEFATIPSLPDKRNTGLLLSPSGSGFVLTGRY